MDNEKNTANGGENTGKTFTQEEVNQIVRTGCVFYGA